MNAKNVLNKIITLLSKDETKMAEAKLVDGTVVESPSFDVEQPLEVVTEDGKVPAPDGEHELVLRDESGNDILIKVTTQDGIIVARENIDLQEEEEKEEDKEMMAEETEEIKPLDAEKEDDDILMKLSYRIEELEKKIKMMEEKEVEDMEEEDEEELPKLNGAPVEQKLSKVNANKNGIKNSQSAFLSRLYK